MLCLQRFSLALRAKLRSSFRRGQPDLGHAHRPRGKGINVSRFCARRADAAAAILGGAAGRGESSRAARALGIEGMPVHRARDTHEPQDCRPHAAHQHRRQRAGCPRRTKPSFLKLLTSLTDCARAIWSCCPVRRPRAPDTLYRDWILACRRRCGGNLDAEGELLRQGVTAGPALIQAQPGGLSGGPAPYDRGRRSGAQGLRWRRASAAWS